MYRRINGEPDGQRPGRGDGAGRETANAEEDKAETPVYQVFIEGGVIRKLWGVETNVYRDHLLRLDAESRRNRFCGTIADDIIRTYAATARGRDAIVHGFFVDGVLRGVADLRILGARPRRPSASRSHGRATVSARRCSNAACSSRATAVSSSWRSAALRKTSACSNSPANLRPS